MKFGCTRAVRGLCPSYIYRKQDISLVECKDEDVHTAMQNGRCVEICMSGMCVATLEGGFTKHVHLGRREQKRRNLEVDSKLSHSIGH